MKHKLVDFIIQFMEEVDKEISEMKLFVRRPIPSANNTSQQDEAPIRMTILTDKLRRLVKCQGEICGRIVPDSS